jgi:hypothetical protein
VLPGGGITAVIVTQPQNDALLLESRALAHLYSMEAGGGKVALLQVANILVDLAEGEDKKLLAGLKVPQL